MKLRFGDRFVHGKPIHQKKKNAFQNIRIRMHGALFQLSFIFCRTKVALILPKLKKSTK